MTTTGRLTTAMYLKIGFWLDESSAKGKQVSIIGIKLVFCLSIEGNFVLRCALGKMVWTVKLGQVIEMGSFEAKLCLINKIKFFGGDEGSCHVRGKGKLVAEF